MNATIWTFISGFEKLFPTASPERRAMDAYVARTGWQRAWNTTPLTFLWVMKYCHDCLVLIIEKEKQVGVDFPADWKDAGEYFTGKYLPFINRALGIAENQLDGCDLKIPEFQEFRKVEELNAAAFLCSTIIKTATRQFFYPAESNPLAATYTEEGLKAELFQFLQMMGKLNARN